MGTILIDQIEAAGMADVTTGEWSATVVQIFQRPEELITCLLKNPAEVDAVVLGRQREEPVKLAEQVRAVARETTVFVITPAGQAEDFQRSSAFSPFLGGNLKCFPAGREKELVVNLREGITKAEQRRRYQEFIAATQPQVVTLSRLLPPPANLLGRLLEYAPIGVVVLDADERIVDLNGQAEAILGLGSAKALGVTLQEVFPASQHESLARFLRWCHMGKIVSPEVFECDCAAGHVSFIEINATRVAGLHQTHFILLILQDITERLQAGQRLMDSLREKEVLLKEIHHRVKNNLTVIGSLFYLQSTTTQDEETPRILQDCQDRVRSMALVHERLYRSDDLASVDFAEYTEELANHLFRNYALRGDRIRLKLDFEKVPLEIDRAIPCGLILTELISNAFKHAFPNGRSGEVRVSLLRIGGDGLVLTVADDGVGLPAESTLQTRRSLGMRLVHSLASQVDARIEFLRRTPGTEVRLRLKDPSFHES